MGPGVHGERTRDLRLHPWVSHGCPVRAVMRAAAAVAGGEDSSVDGLAVGFWDGRVVVVVMMGIVERGWGCRGRHDVGQLLVEEQGAFEGAL